MCRGFRVTTCGEFGDVAAFCCTSFALVTGPRSSLSLKLIQECMSLTIRARLGTTAQFCKVVVRIAPRFVARVYEPQNALCGAGWTRRAGRGAARPRRPGTPPLQRSKPSPKVKALSKSQTCMPKSQPSPKVTALSQSQTYMFCTSARPFRSGRNVSCRILGTESGPFRAVHLSRHKWPGGLVNRD